MESSSFVRCCPQPTASRNNDLKILDCTIRDGGICNDWQFSPSFVRSVFHALRDANIDYMEIGYKSKADAFSKESVGPWRFCLEDDLMQVLEESPVKISTMVDIGRIQTIDIPPAQARRKVFISSEVTILARQADSRARGKEERAAIRPSCS